jgi:hypothetical protein
VRGRAVRLLARAVLAGAIVAAVFAMHGPSAGAGCPGGQSMPGAASTMAIGAAPVAAAVVAAPVATAEHPGHGQVCLSTPLRPGPAALLALVLAILPPLGSAVTPPALARFARRRRAPPPAGAQLLRHLCVSRT